MQSDGNLVVYCTFPRRAVWASNTHGNTNNVRIGARFQDDGNLVLYNKNRGVLWAASSNGGHMMIMQDARTMETWSFTTMTVPQYGQLVLMDSVTPVSKGLRGTRIKNSLQMGGNSWQFFSRI